MKKVKSKDLATYSKEVNMNWKSIIGIAIIFLVTNVFSSQNNNILYENQFEDFKLIFKEQVEKSYDINPLGPDKKVPVFTQKIFTYLLRNKEETLIDALIFKSDEYKPIKKESITFSRIFFIVHDNFYIFQISYKIKDRGYITYRKNNIIYLINKDKCNRVFMEPIYLIKKGEYDAIWVDEKYTPIFDIKDINNDNRVEIVIQGEKHYAYGFKDEVYKDNTWAVNNIYYWDGKRFKCDFNPPTVERGYLTISMAGNRLLFHENVNGEFSGYEVDLAKIIAKRLGLKLRIVNPKKIEKTHEDLLNNMNVDFVLSSLSFEEVKGKNHIQYGNNIISLLTWENYPIKNYNDLKGKKIAIVKNTETESELICILEYNKYIERKNVIIADDFYKAKELFKNKEVDAIMGDKFLLKYLSRDMKNTTVVNDFSHHRERYFILLKKGNERIREILIEVLKKLEHEGIIADLKKKWHLL